MSKINLLTMVYGNKRLEVKASDCWTKNDRPILFWCKRVRQEGYEDICLISFVFLIFAIWFGWKTPDGSPVRIP